MIVLILILALINTFLLVTILAILSKLIFLKSKVKKRQEVGLLDVSSQPRTYGDIALDRPISTDLKLIRDE